MQYSSLAPPKSSRLPLESNLPIWLFLLYRGVLGEWNLKSCLLFFVLLLCLCEWSVCPTVILKLFLLIGVDINCESIRMIYLLTTFSSC